VDVIADSDGNPTHALEDVQTYHVSAGVVFETVFAKNASGEGLYPLSHTASRTPRRALWG
jgi:hypothetical protein